MIKPLPNCLGCIYLDRDGTCGHWHKAKIGKLKLGVKTGKTGGCSLFKGQRTTRRGRSLTDSDERVRDLYDQGRNDREISEALGYCKTSIFNWRARNSLPPNGRRGPKQKKILS